MQEELVQFERNNVWELVPKVDSVNVIGTTWMYKNKFDENANVRRNKSWLVFQGYTQIKGIDADKTFAPVARLESLRLLIEISRIWNLKLYKMDVKSAFLNGFMNKEVYVEQTKGFMEPGSPNYIYKLKKALYGLNQAPRVWYV